MRREECATELRFFMPMRPPTATHQEQQVRTVRGKPVFYEPPDLAEARAKLTAHLAPHRPAKPLGGAVRLIVKWWVPLCGEHPDGEDNAPRPDTDKLYKLQKDDAQVASELCEKFWAGVPGIFICVQELDEKNGGNDGKTD